MRTKWDKMMELNELLVDYDDDLDNFMAQHTVWFTPQIGETGAFIVKWDNQYFAVVDYDNGYYMTYSALSVWDVIAVLITDKVTKWRYYRNLKKKEYVPLYLFGKVGH